MRDSGYFFVNDEYIATLDLSGRGKAAGVTLPAGDVAAAGGYFDVDRVTGAVTNYTGFNVSQFTFNGETAATPTPHPLIVSAGNMDSDAANVRAANVVVSATFTNPDPANGLSGGNWDFGFIFRKVRQNEMYRLVITADDEKWWVRRVHHDGPVVGDPTPTSNDYRAVTDGTASTVDTDQYGWNDLVLIAVGSTGHFFLNDTYMGKFNISDSVADGDVEIGPVFLQLHDQRQDSHVQLVLCLDSRQVTQPNGPSHVALDLAARARAGERDAFDRLHDMYAKAIYGFVRVRLANDADAQDLVQETWLQVWQKLPTYDPDRASFVTFVKYWASVLLLRAYDRRDRRRGVEVLVHDLIRHNPDLTGEEGVGDILDRLTSHTTPSAEPVQLAEVYAELLHATFGSPSPPHQLIAFGFIKALGWPPRRVAAELSDAALDGVERQLEQAYVEDSQLPDQQVRPSFDLLRHRMHLRFGEAVADRKTQATYPHLADHVVGETRLRDYYTGDDPTTDLTQWWYAVHRRVRGEVQRTTVGALGELAAARAASASARKAVSTSISVGDSVNA